MAALVRCTKHRAITKRLAMGLGTSATPCWSQGGRSLPALQLKTTNRHQIPDPFLLFFFFFSLLFLLPAVPFFIRSPLQTYLFNCRRPFPVLLLFNIFQSDFVAFRLILSHQRPPM